jgi:hypothetical protein
MGGLLLAMPLLNQTHQNDFGAARPAIESAPAKFFLFKVPLRQPDMSIACG